MHEKNQIWYRQPADCWEAVHPIGNGSLGAIIWGTVDEELLGLNLDTLWSGTKRDTNNYHAKEYLEPVRKEVFAGHYAKAAQMVEKHLLGEFGENYLPMGNLRIRVNAEGKAQEETKQDSVCQNYERVLDLEKGIATVSYREEDAAYTREHFASYMDHLIAANYTAEKPMKMEFSFTSELRIKTSITDDTMQIDGQCPEHVEPSYLQSDHPIIWGEQGICFTTKVHILDTDGIVQANGQKLFVTNATYCVFTISAKSGDRDQPTQVPEVQKTPKNYEQLKKAHQEDYQALFSKVDIGLGETPDLPTDERLRRIKEGAEDPALYALFFQYGRYLLIASSREGSEAANLQGIWNWQMRAPWSSNYTTNINVEMNYWPAQICNLSECMEPYFSLLAQLVPNGKKTAQVHFGCRGFCVGHNTDYWRITNPVGVPYGQKEGVEGSSLYAFFVLSGQWMCQELWKAYRYQKDIAFLRDFAYPILREAALFALDWLVEYDGYYVTCPSASPENQFRTDEGVSPISMGSTMDMTIIRETFTNFENAYKELQSKGEETGDWELIQEIHRKQEKLLPYRIAEDRRLQEWIYPFAETEEGHRHISHAYGLFPGEEFRNDEILKKACKESIEYRLSHGGGHTGWSCAWIANLFAVLGDGEKSFFYMKTLLTKSICPNLWTNHPPFQIDANFAGTMAMAQMFVQEQGDEVLVLPAIPKEWDSGYVKGLCLTDNRTIDISWEKGQITYKIPGKTGQKS